MPGAHPLPPASLLFTLVSLHVPLSWPVLGDESPQAPAGEEMSPRQGPEAPIGPSLHPSLPLTKVFGPYRQGVTQAPKGTGWGLPPHSQPGACSPGRWGPGHQGPGMLPGCSGTPGYYSIRRKSWGAYWQHFKGGSIWVPLTPSSAAPPPTSTNTSWGPEGTMRRGSDSPDRSG